jgi:cysteine synthase
VVDTVGDTPCIRVNSLAPTHATIYVKAAIEWSRKLAQKEGIFTGISGGATFAIAMQVAEKAPAGSVLLAMLPDTGERYLSTPLFEASSREWTTRRSR